MEKTQQRKAKKKRKDVLNDVHWFAFSQIQLTEEQFSTCLCISVHYTIPKDNLPLSAMEHDSTAHIPTATHNWVSAKQQDNRNIRVELVFELMTGVFFCFDVSVTVWGPHYLRHEPDERWKTCWLNCRVIQWWEWSVYAPDWIPAAYLTLLSIWGTITINVSSSLTFKECLCLSLCCTDQLWNAATDTDVCV